MGDLKFDEYRFHFRPYGARDLFNNPEEQLKKKNDLLQIVLQTGLVFRNRNLTLKHIYQYLGDNCHHFKIANRKKARIEHDFERQDIEHHPSANVFILNDPDEQKILIESDRTSFGESKAVAKIIERTLNKELMPLYLAVSVKPEIEESELWELLRRYQGRITSLEFSMLYPNLPKSHSTISDELKKAYQSLGSVEGKLEFKAEKGGTLKNLVEDNDHLRSLNTAASLQGMPIKVRVEKEKTKKTGKSVKSVVILEGVTHDPEQFAAVVKSLLKSVK